MNPDRMNATALAYVGDAVHELFIRERVVQSGVGHADRLHKKSIPHVCAQGQARAIKALWPTLSAAEQSLARRARNRRPSSKSRSADILVYKWATAFEALIGYLYLKEQRERALQLLEQAADIIEEKE